MTKPSVMVVQMGARRNYIYAEQLERAGMLHSLATDLAWSGGGGLGIGQLLAHAQLSANLSGVVERRTVKNVSPAKLKSSILPHLMRVAFAWQAPEKRFVAADAALGIACMARGLRGANVIVNYLGNGGPFLGYAKRRGAKIATDFICMPSILEIEEQERQRWPAWGGEAVSPAVINSFRLRMQRLLALSDIYLCPSQTVADDLARLPGFDQSRVRITPYGASGFERLPGEQPVRGRVLFAGVALPRKGLPYLGLAAALLETRGIEVEIVVAGKAPHFVQCQPETRNLKFLGVLDRDRMAAELAKADVFCLPSLTEGSSSAIYEALSFGVPVVTTASSGSVVTDGLDGYIVPEREVVPIADSICRLVQDRDQRQRMSSAAIATAARYSDVACGEAFIRVVRELQDN